MAVEIIKRCVRGAALAAAAVLAFGASSARADLQITEIMFNPGGDENTWEWIEVQNTDMVNPVDVDGWVFDDDDPFGSNFLSAFNLGVAGNMNTIIPAGGTAVLFDGFSVNPEQRFRDAWEDTGSSIVLIPVDFPPEQDNGGDRLGLWNSFASYDHDATVTTAGDFTAAVAEIDYSAVNGFPTASNHQSIYWTGAGDWKVGSNWAASVDGVAGAHTSVVTGMSMQAINDVDDLGTPGTILQGTAGAASGLLVTEIMYNPRSPELGAGSYAESNFEYVELYNNTGSAIDFSSTPYWFDDVSGTMASEDGPNISSGVIPAGGTAVLVNVGELLTIADHETMWETDDVEDINFIEVTTWPALNNTTTAGNSGDTIAFWTSQAAYDADKAASATNPASWTGYSQLLNYDINENGWPDDDGFASINLADLSLDPTVGSNWLLTGDILNGDPGGFHPDALVNTVFDHEGDDVGSPGFVPTAPAGLPGDYNEDDVVDGADYTTWRDAVTAGLSALPNRDSLASGLIDEDDFLFWRTHYGDTLGSGSGSGSAAVPEPGSLALLVLGLAGLWIGRRSRC